MDEKKNIESTGADPKTPDEDPQQSASDGTTLDFSNEQASDVPLPVIKVGGEYDPRPQEDGARRKIAFLLIGLLWLIISGILILLSCGTIHVADLKEFSVVLGPIVTLVSAATGFYYGTKSHSVAAR